MEEVEGAEEVGEVYHEGVDSLPLMPIAVPRPEDGEEDGVSS